MNLSPGDRVRITQDALQYAELWFLVATRGSTARVLSFQEYCNYINNLPITGGCGQSVEDVARTRAAHLELVKHWMEEEQQTPILFETVQPPDPALKGAFDVLDCSEGSALTLGSDFFEPIKNG